MNHRSFRDALSYARARAHEMRLEQISEAQIYLRPDDYYLMGSVYPPLKAMHEIDHEAAWRRASDDLSLYLHIPFCDQYCTFCHFAKVINPAAEKVRRYLGALRSELEGVATKLGGARRVTNVYFGGGTPSYLDAGQIGALFGDIRRHLALQPDAEITYELHPNFVRRPDRDERLDAMLANGVNRFTYGVQSMDDRVLEKLNRGHTSGEAVALLETLRGRGQHNVSVDVMFGLPYQTTESWYETLVRLVDAGATKFNVFPLMFKAGDPVTLHYLQNPEIFPTAADRIAMHFICDYVLVETAGYHCGPVFYYSKEEGVPSQQQAAKFENIDAQNLLGLGVSAFSYVGGAHYYNVCELDQYMRASERGAAPVWLGYELGLDEKVRRTAMMALRAGGVSRAVFGERFGVDPKAYFTDQFATLERLGLAAWRDGDTLALTPDGVLHADGIGMMFASQHVRDLVAKKNEEIATQGRQRANLVERHDYSPLHRQLGELTKDLRANVANRRRLLAKVESTGR